MKKEILSQDAVRLVLSDYWNQYKTKPWQSIFAFFLPAIGSILVSFVPPLIVGKIINIFISQNQISLNSVSNYLLLFAGLWLLGEVFWRFGVYFLIKMEARGMNSLNKLAFKRLMDREYDFFANNFVGSMTKKSLAYSKNYETFSDTLVFNVTTNLFPLIFVIIVLWQYSPIIPAILVGCLVGGFLLAVPLIKKRSKLVALRHDAGSKMVGRLSDSLTNMIAAKSFAREQKEYEVYGDHVNDFINKFEVSVHYHNSKLDVLLSPIYVGTNLIGIIAAIYFANKLNLQAGAIVVIFAYYSQITRMFWEINRTYRSIESSITEAAEFTQMVVEPTRIQDVKGAKNLIVKKATIDFHNATFHYDETERDEDEDSFLQDFNLVIKDKEKIGLVGPSGSGKTTITKLLLRFAELQSGDITIDGQNINNVTQTSLRDSIAYVPQEPLLFHRSLFENIAYGDPKASKEEIIKASKIAHAHDFIEELPHGYETLVGERGIKLSGGQRQRIAIARALLKKAPILVLDEATSALDSESEKYIQEGLWELMKDKTALVIAHRLSTIKHLDRIIVLEDGQIVQDGTHDELLKEKGLYATLWSHQTGDSLPPDNKGRKEASIEA